MNRSSVPPNRRISIDAQSQRHRLLSTIVLALSLLLLPAIAAAQGFTGTITGFVTDSSGANIPDATVTVTETATKIVHITKSNGAGVFTVPQLNPGTYDVQIEKSGFSKALRQAITLTVGSAAGLVQVNGSLRRSPSRLN